MYCVGECISCQAMLCCCAGEEAAEISSAGHRNSKQLSSSVQEFIYDLFDKYVDPLLAHIRKTCKQAISAAGQSELSSWLLFAVHVIGM